MEEGNERMFGSIRSVTSSAVRALQYTTRQQATPLSVRQWVSQGAARHAGSKGGVLFLPYKGGEIAATGSVISAWIRLGIFEAMERHEGDQRLWFVADELDVLGEIDGLKDALARLRKFGGRCILGFQSIAQVSGTYSKGSAETIVENCGNTLILRCSGSERGGTSEFASKLIGQREVMHTTKSRTRKSTDWLSSSTTNSEQLKIEPAVLASEIERLPDLAGYLKITSIPDWVAVKLTRTSEPEPAPPQRPARVVTPSAPEPQTPVPSPATVAPEPPAPAPSPVAATPADNVAPRRRKPRAAPPKRTRSKKRVTKPADAPPHDVQGERAAPPQIVVPPEIPAPTNGLGPVQNLTGGAKSPD
jgi:type IV secretory pathway TraG/TraD family ATPase VirD4